MKPGTGPNLKQRTLAMAAAAIVIVVAMVAYQIWQAYGVTVENARRDIQELTQVLAASTEATFRSAELIVDHVVEEVHDDKTTIADGQALIGRFIDIADKWAFVQTAAFVDAAGTPQAVVARGDDGHLRAATGSSDLSGARLFLTHRNASPAVLKSMYISIPVPAVATDMLVIAISKAVRGADGAFEGVCVITISLELFTNLFAGLLPAQYRAASLLRRDGALLAHTQADAPLGRSFAKGELFTSKLPAAAAGVYRTTPEDGIERLVGYQASNAYPIVVSVNAFWNRMLTDWRANSFVLAGSALIGVLMIGALTFWLVRHIDAQQLAQQALVRSEHSLAESQRLAGIAHFERDTRTNAQFWGENMYAVHGVDRKTFVPSRSTFLDLVLPEDREQVIQNWGSADSPSHAGNVECRIVRPGGGIRHMRYRWRLVHDGQAVPTRVFGVALDVTAIRTAESIILHDEQRLRDIVECSSDYIWKSDAEGRITFFAGADAAKFGKAGRVPRLLTGDGTDGDAVALRTAFQAREKIRNLIASVTDANGDPHWVRTSANPRFDAQGQFVGYRGAGTDVTEIRRRQEREEDHRQSEALGRLASGLAHEINNLLQPIMIYTAFGSSEGGLPAKVTQYFTRIGKAADRASQIVKNVLAFARRSHSPHEFVSPVEIAHESVDLISGTLSPDVAITVNDASGGFLVRADRTGLAQVLTNLLSNAADAMPAGGRIAVSVTAAAVAGEGASGLSLPPGAYCRLAVEDNGAGIGAENIGKVFDPFFTTKPQGKGTGLGLAVVAGLVKSWGGAVAAESVPGERTTFVVYLPIAERQLQAAQ